MSNENALINLDMSDYDASLQRLKAAAIKSKNLGKDFGAIFRCNNFGGKYQNNEDKLKFWWTDEKIIYTPVNRGDSNKELNSPKTLANELRRESWKDKKFNLSVSGLNSANFDLIDVSFSSKELLKKENFEKESLSFVVQCIFIIITEDGDYFYGLHDRSYSGAEDALSKYALITGRVNLSDFIIRNELMVQLQADQLFRNALCRELQESDELNLEKTLSHKLIKRARYVDAFLNQENDVATMLSALYFIPISVQEYDFLCKRGPYLVPVQSEEFGKLRVLGLINDILHTNTCNLCTNEFKGKFKLKENMEFFRRPCIIKSVDDRIAGLRIDSIQKSIYKEPFLPDQYDEHRIDGELPFQKYKIEIKNDTTIIAVDISNYSLLQSQQMLGMRDQLQRLIYHFMPSLKHDEVFKEELFIQTTGDGFKIFLKNVSGSYRTLLMFFFAFYLRSKVSNLKGYFGENDIHDIRIALHSATIDIHKNLGEYYYPGNAAVVAHRILDFAQNGQILASQQFLIQTISEIEMFANSMQKTTKRGRNSICNHITNQIDEIGLLYGGVSIRGVSKSSKTALEPFDYYLFIVSNLVDLFRELKLPPDIYETFIEDLSKVSHQVFKGIEIIDFGYFSDKHNFRHRVFNVNLPKNDVSLEFKKPRSPFEEMMVLPRKDKEDREFEFKELIASFEDVKDLTILGYSNVNLLGGILENFENFHLFKNLFKLTILFYEYELLKFVNEPRRRIEAQIDWYIGLLRAIILQCRLGKEKVDIKIMTNHYGFNLVKAIYTHNADPIKNADHVRITIPYPGARVNYSPVIKVERGHSLFHSHLRIVEHYIEGGILDAEDKRCVIDVKKLGWINEKICREKINELLALQASDDVNEEMLNIKAQALKRIFLSGKVMPLESVIYVDKSGRVVKNNFKSYFKAVSLTMLCDVDRKRVVLLKRGKDANDMNSTWALHSGKVNTNDALPSDLPGKKLSREAFRNAACREFIEELSYDVKSSDLEYVQEFPMVEGEKMLFFTLFALKIKHEQIKIMYPDQREIDELKAFTLSEFTNLPNLGDAIQFKKKAIENFLGDLFK